ncbi:hypothetical protein Q9Q95_05485 [Sphingomonas sp. DG1-23]|uniref:hypothetical protein n=1 Tax=Sphingomonas sp. DG1-23 TaxID=3068316 RepID=UPI00273E4119|nr:hypothetical protein [Sphingomonas sp. DG1-23]MDP5278368.1 hypothetical protein [Sphingomonas sp. DG1-23]
MMGPDEPVPVPQPAPSTEAGDPPEIPVENHSPPLASAGPQAGGAAGMPPRTAAREAEGGLVPCDAVDDDVPAADCREYTRQKSRLRPGVLAFDPPAKMTVDTTYDLTLSIGKAADVEEVRAVVRRAGRRLEERALQVGAFMTATLTGNAFEIALQGTEGPSRSLGADRRDVWQWQVKPLRAGSQRLLLTVSADAMGPDGKRRRFSLANRPVDVLVEVSASQRREDRTKAIEDSLGRGARVMGALQKWLIGLAALLAAAGGAWLAMRKFGKRKDPTGDKPSAKP